MLNKINDVLFKSFQNKSYYGIQYKQKSVENMLQKFPKKDYSIHELSTQKIT